MLAAPLHPSQAALRLESLVRTAVAEEEFEIRYDTFAERGHILFKLAELMKKHDDDIAEL